MDDTQRPGPDEASLREWLAEHAAHYAKIDPYMIDYDTPLSQYGLDSVCAVALAVDVEDEFGVVLEVDTLWKVPTVNLVAQMLVTEHLQESAQ